jgi:hypothetical protein
MVRDVASAPPFSQEEDGSPEIEIRDPKKLAREWAETLGAHYCKHNYYVSNGAGTYQERNPAEFKRDLYNCGVARFQNEILNIVDHERAVDWAGEVAGYKAGVHTFETKKFLVTRGPHIIKARRCPCPMIREILQGMLDPEPRSIFLAWLKLGRDALREGVPRPGQVLILCGPQNCGKSVTQKLIITPLLGGRSAKCCAHRRESGLILPI